MKTVKNWLKDYLSEEDYMRAEEYKSERWGSEVRSFKDALLYAFTWDDTEERYDYWDKIHENGGSLPTDQIRANKHPIGLTKREYFAGLAMQSLAGLERQSSESHSKYVARRVAIQAVFFADELLKQLEK